MRTPSMKLFNVNVVKKRGVVFFAEKDLVCPKAKILIIKQER